MHPLLEQKITQQLQLTPKMEQSLQILQMDHLELADYIQQLSLENPVLELETPDSSEEVPLSRKLEWLEKEQSRERIDLCQNTRESNADRPLERLAETQETMEDYLMEQLAGLEMTPACRRAVDFLVGCLDDKGYLGTSIEELETQSTFSVEELEGALTLLRQLDPAGVGACNLGDCILLQLERNGRYTPALEQVVRHHLEQLGRGSYRAVGEAVGLTAAEVREMAHLISELNPKPCASLGSPRYMRYIQPDLVVVRFQDHFDILISDYLVPRIIINRDYLHLLGGETDAPTVRYIEEKFRQAQWVTQAVQNRSKTLLEVGRLIVEYQQDFFCDGSTGLRPLKLADLAGKLGLHPSTISRAVNGKYLQCSCGVFPLKYFFAASLEGKSGENLCNTGVREMVRELISAENPAAPYSDQAIAGLLADRGVQLSRRTVAKYRDQLGIPLAAARRA